MRPQPLTVGVQTPQHDLMLAVCTRDWLSSQTQRTLKNLAGQSWPPNSALLLVVNQDLDADDYGVQNDALEMIPVPTYMAFESRRGFAAVRNCALSWASGCTAILFLDDDTVVESHWIENMWRHSQHFSSDVIGSLHTRVDSVPIDQDLIDGIAISVRGSSLPTLSGSNGLLLPIATVGVHRFNEFYNESGGEDTELLLRLRLEGYSEYVVDCMAIEEDRLLTKSWRADARLAFSGGALWTHIHQNLGLATFRIRLRALVGLLPALVSIGLGLTQAQPRRRRHLRRFAARLGVLLATKDGVWPRVKKIWQRA